jgi:hypothetical protein
MPISSKEKHLEILASVAILMIVSLFIFFQSLIKAKLANISKNKRY